MLVSAGRRRPGAEASGLAAGHARARQQAPALADRGGRDPAIRPRAHHRFPAPMIVGPQRLFRNPALSGRAPAGHDQSALGAHPTLSPIQRHRLPRRLPHSETTGGTYDIGGPDILTYEQLLQIYAKEAGLRKRIIIPVRVDLDPERVVDQPDQPGADRHRPAADRGADQRMPSAATAWFRDIIPQRLLTCREAIRIAGWSGCARSWPSRPGRGAAGRRKKRPNPGIPAGAAGPRSRAAGG